MAKIYTSVEQLIGRTPLMELCNIEKQYGLSARLYAKLEFFNPAGSIKDRVAKHMLDDAAEKGLLVDGATVIEPTSGNTGIGLAAVCAARGIRLIIVMPDSMSVERINTMKAYGAELVLTPGALGMSGAIAKAEELNKSIENSFIAGQFTNPANPETHKLSTAPEIWEDTDGDLDCLVAGVGTGGTITGIGEYLKEKKPSLKVVGIEPATSAVLSGREKGAHDLQGIGAGFVPEILNTKVYDEILPVTDNDAYEMGRTLGKAEGILCGITSGAALWAAVELAKRPEYAGKKIVVILPDTGSRYMSTKLFS